MTVKTACPQSLDARYSAGASSPPAASQAGAAAFHNPWGGGHAGWPGRNGASVGSAIWTRDKIPAPGDFVVLLFCEGDFRECIPAGTGRPVRGLHPFPANRVRSWFHLFSLSAGSHQSSISEISTLARSFLPGVRENPIGGVSASSVERQNWSVRTSWGDTRDGRIDSAGSKGTRRRPRPGTISLTPSSRFIVHFARPQRWPLA